LNLKTIEKIVSQDKELTDEQKEFLVKKVETYWTDHPDVTNRFPRWRKYIAWVAGYQLYDYNKISKKLVEVPLSRQHKLIFNRLRPYVKTILAKLAADQPQMSIVPITTDDDDIRAALVGSKVIEGLAEKIGFTQQLNYIKSWLIICNRAYMRVFWDEKSVANLGYTEPVKEETLEPVGEGIASTMEEASPTPTKTEMATVEGDVNIISVPPFNCRPDPLYGDREYWRWFVYGREEDANDVEDEYGLERNTLKEPSQTMDQAYNLELQDEQDIMIGAPDKREDIAGRTIIVKELWTPKMWVFIAGDKVLDYGKNDYGEIPFFPFEEKIIPIESYQREYQYNESVIKDLIPLQREYNRVKSIMSIAIDRASKLKVLAPLGSILSKRQWVNDYAVFLDVNTRMGEPHQLKLDPFPIECNQYSADIVNEMESLFSLSPASFGRLPERASHASGTLVNLLIEQDDVVLNPLLNHINDVVADIWSLAMRIVQDKYGAERIIQTTGEDGGPDAVKFMGADLRGNTDVKISSQTGLPRSRALKIEYLMKLREIGLLTDDRSMLEMLELGQAERIFKESILHEKKARRENARILDNPEILPQDIKGWVYPLEDHITHIKIHLMLRLGVEWDRLTPNQKQALELHIIETHKMMAPPPVVSGPSGQGGSPTPNEPAAKVSPGTGSPGLVPAGETGMVE
jgi:hypothetical protein